jgi:4-hydroxy-3-polyprenylbenzoate decarboxylase
MAYTGLYDFISELEKNGELHKVKEFVDPLLEITEVTDRITKSGGKALLFENTGTAFPVLINSFGSDRRMALALSRINLGNAAADIEEMFNLVTGPPSTLRNKIKALPRFLKIAGCFPVRKKGRGICQQVVISKPDLGILPVLKCWPHDGGRFITLPMVHTIHPETGKMNVGMYRMQILDRENTAMHWQRHKTGASHFEAYRKLGIKMPVSVALGGDPAYTYCSTAPLPENINEYILAGFLRKKKVSLVKCITNNIYVPSDADIVIEGYVDPAEEPVTEGPFGDHTGFYSLAGLYPGFHVTCITHSRKAVYPATIVGIPPQEDAWLTKATEKIFLSPVRLAVQPEIVDFHMPVAGAAHNLVIVRINKTYPGQGLKVINSMFGAGQMMFTKYLAVVSGNIDIRNYRELVPYILANTRFDSDIIFTRGPLDVLDHSSDSYSFGGKAGIDATVKMPEELTGRQDPGTEPVNTDTEAISGLLDKQFIKWANLRHIKEGVKVLILGINPSEDPDNLQKVVELLKSNGTGSIYRLAVVVDHTVETEDTETIAWQVLANSDPQRDHYMISASALLIDGTIKLYRKGGFPRRWPNVVCSYLSTIESVNRKWESLGFESFILSPSLRYSKLLRRGTDEIIT